MKPSPERMPTTLSVEIDRLLQDAIIDGRLAPGERLIADDIAEQFGVSRIPVRESLRALDAAGWVTIKPRHGVYVRRWSRTELQQLFEVRTALEGEAARLAAQRRTNVDLEQIESNVTEYAEALESEHESIAELNRQFHRLVAAASGNAVLHDMLEQIGRRVKWYFNSVTMVRSGESVREHRALLALIEAGDSEAAESLMRSHVSVTRDAIAAVLDGVAPELIEP